jgi:methionyl-tRNA formyltransferase
MRIAFMGTPDFAIPALDALVAAGHDVVVAYCQPPRAANRGKALTPSVVQSRAQALGIAVRCPVNFKAAADIADFAGLGLDIAVVAAYGLILPQAILVAPKHGCINIHGSLLPRWRGAAPVHRAILAGDTQTGVTLMQMARGLDTGPMLAQRTVPIIGQTGGELSAELAVAGAQLLTLALADFAALVPQDQPEAGVSYAHKIDKAEARLDFSQPAETVNRSVRAFNPAPGAFVDIGGERLKIHRAEIVQAHGTPGTILDDRLLIACGAGAVRPLLVQRQGRPMMTTAELLRGWRLPVGLQIG